MTSFQRNATLGLCVFVLFSELAYSAALVRQDPLRLVYSADKSFCNRIFHFYTDFRDCRLNDADCFWRYWATGKGIWWITQYSSWHSFGHSSVNVFDIKAQPLQGHAVVSVADFQGDKFPLLNEIWKVDRVRLEELLKLPIKQGGKSEYSREFQELLDGGEKLSKSEAAYVFEVDGKPYVFERQCTGAWVLGPNYICNRVIGITVIDIGQEDKKSHAVCQLRSVSKD